MEIVDNSEVFNVLMANFSKAFDCLYHVLLITNPEAYCFDLKSMRLNQQYFQTEQYFQTKQYFQTENIYKVRNAYSSYKEYFYGILQRVNLCPFIGSLIFFPG